MTPSTWLLVAKGILSRTRRFLLSWAALAVVFTVILVIGTSFAPPLSYIPEPRDVGFVLGTLLTAQAAIAALTLAVTLFMMQGANAKADVDDRMYREYIRRSWVRIILWISLLAVGTTGALLLVGELIRGDLVTADYEPELRNLVLVAGIAGIVNLVLAVILFERALLHSGPGQWMALRRHVNETDVREAVQAFLGRLRRARKAREAEGSDLSVLFPDRGEGSADQAIRALLDHARRAMSERRYAEFKLSLDSILELIKYAMKEIRSAGISWGPPGSQAQWPPLRELSRNLYSFREDVIRQGDRDYMQELYSFDFKLTTEGMRERCGELFSVALSGYRWNYQIVNRIGSDVLREQIRDRFSLNAEAFIFGAGPQDRLPYTRELVRQQERILSDAMHSDQSSDFEQLHGDFQARLSAMGFNWEDEGMRDSDTPASFKQLEQQYRIALMGLSGRAIQLDQENRIADARPYLNVARQANSQLERLADDVGQALVRDESQRFFSWEEWEMEGAPRHQPTRVVMEQYPWLFFALRLMELSSEPLPTLDLHGRAQRTLEWFLNNAESVEAFVQAEPEPALEQRREFATESLRSAVRRDEITEDYEIIARGLSETRITAFTAQVYGAASSSNLIERLFEQAGASLHVAGDDPDGPEERILSRLEHKGFLTDSPADSHSSFSPLDGSQWGHAISDDVDTRFCEMLEGAPKIELTPQTPLALVGEINQALEALGDPEQAIVVLAGNWSDLQGWLNMGHLAEFQPEWRMLESQRIGGFGRYRGHPVLSSPAYNGQHIYVVDLGSWGQFLHAEVDDGRDIRVDVNAISADRAQELLENNPNHFSNEPDEESKLRKLQACVEIVIGARKGFRVTDPSRARNLVPMPQHDEDDKPSES